MSSLSALGLFHWIGTIYPAWHIWVLDICFSSFSQISIALMLFFRQIDLRTLGKLRHCTVSEYRNVDSKLLLFRDGYVPEGASGLAAQAWGWFALSPAIPSLAVFLPPTMTGLCEESGPWL